MELQQVNDDRIVMNASDRHEHVQTELSETAQDDDTYVYGTVRFSNGSATFTPR